MDEVKVKIKPLYEDTILPILGSEDAACVDLYAHTSAVIAPHTSEKIGVGFAIAPPKGYVSLIFARSGLSTKEGLRPANCVGVVDRDYRNEVIVALYNDSDIERTVFAGERIAQLMVLPYPKLLLDPVEELDETERGLGGFGSTGV